ncbi:MAG TPA: multidrug efflux MFS transporter [Oscillatoriaceae cyanobacterium]
MPIWQRNLYACWLGCFITGTASSLVMPFMPLFIEQLGVHSVGAIEQWSGFAYGATFLLAALVAPLWGRLADQHGRRLMLLRASLAMAVVMSLMGLAQNVYQLTFLRLLFGGALGFNSSSIALVATQTPREKSGWALGTLATGSIAGSLIGPLLGGYLAEVMGLRNVFFVTGVLLFATFMLTMFLVKETFVPDGKPPLKAREVWQRIPHPGQLWALFATVLILWVANLSIEPIVTVYIKQLAGNTDHVALISGMVFAASGLATVLVAPSFGKLSDRVGPRTVLLGSLIAAAVLFVPQAFVQNPWQLLGLRFLMGVAGAGLVPSVNTLIKHMVPNEIAGRVYGYSQSAQFLGGLVGPVMGGQMAAFLGIRAVFFSTCLLLLLNAAWVYFNGRKSAPQAEPPLPSPEVVS